MKKEILNYQGGIQEKLKEDLPGEDWEELSRDYLIKIGFYQHERLIHLIVTVTFALLEVAAIVGAVIGESMGLAVLALGVLVLLIPYVGHYYFLENEVQKMYRMYDEIQKKCHGGIKND